MCRGGFQILEEGELSRYLGEGESVPEALARLSEKKFIELRYAEEGTYCVRTMPEGRSYAERIRREERERRGMRRALFTSAFWGGASGGAAVAFLAFLIGRIFGV